MLYLCKGLHTYVCDVMFMHVLCGKSVENENIAVRKNNNRKNLGIYGVGKAFFCCHSGRN